MYSLAPLFIGLLSGVALATPLHHHGARVVSFTGHDDPDIPALLEENQEFRNNIAHSDDPELLAHLAANGQHPPYMFLGCSDSRVSEGTIFDAEPGTFFTERNIANQFYEHDNNAHSVLAYILADLTVKHVLVVGHLGCGGVGAAIASPPALPLSVADQSIQSWIQPIRDLYKSSSRQEIVDLRNANAANTTVVAPRLDHPGYIALVEENVKQSVQSIVSSKVMVEHWSMWQANNSAVEPVFVHGWVYDIRNGSIYDLDVTQGPPGAPSSKLSLAPHASANRISE